LGYYRRANRNTSIKDALARPGYIANSSDREDSIKSPETEKIMSKKFVVKWEIDIEADSPIEAAKEALKCQGPDSDATVFTVREEKSNFTHIIDGATGEIQ
jgi:hypothetical protein